MLARPRRHGLGEPFRPEKNKIGRVGDEQRERRRQPSPENGLDGAVSDIMQSREWLDAAALREDATRESKFVRRLPRSLRPG